MIANSPLRKGNTLVRSTSKSFFHVASTLPAGDVSARFGGDAGLNSPTPILSRSTVFSRKTYLVSPPSGGPSFTAASCSRTTKNTVSRAGPEDRPPWSEGRAPPYAPRSLLPDTGAGNPVDCSDGADRFRRSKERLRCVFRPYLMKGVPNEK